MKKIRAEMRTGQRKSQKTTEIYFDEASPVVNITTYNIDLKKRLAKYAARFPNLCKLTDRDEETGCSSFEIEKRHFCFRFTAPYSEERREAARQQSEMV